MQQAKEQIDSAWQQYATPEGDCRRSTFIIPEFRNRDHWFHPDVQRDLVRLKNVLATIEDLTIRDFLLVVYSSIIIAKGPSTVANALDIAHSRAHFVAREKVPDVWTRFQDRYRRGLSGMRDFLVQADLTVATVTGGIDARQLPYGAQLADAIVTSPPYVTAIEYPRSHKFSMWWIGELLGVHHCVYDRLRYDYIGTVNLVSAQRSKLRGERLDTPSADAAIAALDEVDPLSADRVRQYLHEMRRALSEMLRVLKENRYAVLVVGDSTMRGITVPTGACLIELAEQLEVEGSRFVFRNAIPRVIRERSRQMPIKRGHHGNGIKTESVIILQRVRAH